MTTDHILNRPIWHSLTGTHAHLALGDIRALRYRPAAHFFAAAAEDRPECQAALAGLLGQGGTLGLLEAERSDLPPGLCVRSCTAINQMVLISLIATGAPIAFDDKTDADPPDMLALAKLTVPGPYFAETHRLGDFIGIRQGGRLIAMAGERTKPPGFTEISAVCTHPYHRGRGHARALMQIVIARILERGDAAFLHVYADNPAVALYEALGFRFRRQMTYTILESNRATFRKSPVHATKCIATSLRRHHHRRDAMKNVLVIPALAAAFVALAPASAQTAQESARFTAAQDRFSNEMQIFRSESDRYRAAVQRRGNGNGSGYRQAPPYDSRYDDSRYPDDDDRVETNYEPSQYYRSGGNYQERTLSANERVYRGTDGQYYCKRSDGTTGLVLGAAGGGILGNVIDGGHSRVVGTLIGGALGAVAGKAIDQNQNQVRCR